MVDQAQTDDLADGHLPEAHVELPPGPLAKLERVLFHAEQTLLVFLIAVMVGLAFAQAVAPSGLTWTLDLLKHLVLIVAFLGASLATREGRHLSIDVLPRLLPPRVRVVLKAFIDVFSAVFCAILANATWIAIQAEEGAAFTVGQIEVSRQFFFTLILAGFVLIAVRFLIRGAEDFWHGWTGKLEPEAPPI